MSQPPHTQQTVHLVGCYLRTSSLTLFGGKVLHGCLTDPPQSPPQPLSSPKLSTSELKAFCNTVTLTSPDWIEDRYHSFSTLCRITAWVLRFFSNIRAIKTGADRLLTPSLTTKEFKSAEAHLYMMSQDSCFTEERHQLTLGEILKTTSIQISLKPTIVSTLGGLLTVGRRLNNSSLS